MLDRKSWTHTILCKLFVVDKNTWYYHTVCKKTIKKQLHKTCININVQLMIFLTSRHIAQSAGVVEYTGYFSAEG